MLTDKRIDEIEAAVEVATCPPVNNIGEVKQFLALTRLAETAIPELLAERKEREGEIGRLEASDKRIRRIIDKASGVFQVGTATHVELCVEALRTRAETAEQANAALREQIEKVSEAIAHPQVGGHRTSLTARGVMNKIRAILAGKDKPQ